MQEGLLSMKKTCYLQINPDDTELQHFGLKAFRCPSNDHFGDLLRHFYRAMRPMLIREMELNHSLVDAISLDHTFKVTARIFSTKDKQKKKQFNAMLIVMSQDGLILGFTLVRSMSLEDDLSKKLLQHINRNQNITMVVVDSCCIVRKKLHAILPSLDRVVLDVFHGLQRVSTKEKSCDFTAPRKEMFNRRVSCGRI